MWGNMMIKMLKFLTLILFSPTIYAAGFTAWATPTEIVTASDGILIKGAFGNPGGCGDSSGVYLRNDTNHYNFVKYSALVALMKAKQMRFYIAECYTGYNGLNTGLAYQNRHIGIKN
jgi:hypothetical protein